MTIGEIMKRLAGDDREWVNIDPRMARDMANADVTEVILGGMDARDGKPFIFRLAIGQCLVKKQ